MKTFIKYPGFSTLLYTFLILISGYAALYSQTPAFPGAEGFGAYTTGGRGGVVLEVTNLNDSGPGSLREALEESSGPRTIVFRVSGTIELNSTLRIDNDDVTVAGQTAPGSGICIKNYTTRLAANNVILRFIRFRLGDEAQEPDDCIWGREQENIIIDHCSMSWSIDECASFYDNKNFTLQWCLIAESLNNSFHPKGTHGYGGIWGGEGATFHHNLFAHHTSRNPRFNGARYTTTIETELVDFANNVLYNWQDNSAYGGESGNINMRNNYYKYGPATSFSKRNRIIEPYDTAGNWYVDGNYVEGYPDITADNWNGGVQGSYASYQKNKKRTEPFEVADINFQTPGNAYHWVVNYAGAMCPMRDSVDSRVLNEVVSGISHFGSHGIIDSQSDVGGYPTLNSTAAPTDSDHDGMPDEWETTNGLNPNDASDRNDTNAEGYTMLEVYINSLVAEQIPVSVDSEANYIPENFKIVGNYPNPFNPSTKIRYEIPSDGFVEIKVYNIQGACIDILYNGYQNAGIYNQTWNASASNLASGIYFAVIRYKKTQLIQKMMLLK